MTCSTRFSRAAYLGSLAFVLLAGPAMADEPAAPGRAKKASVLNVIRAAARTIVPDSTAAVAPEQPTSKSLAYKQIQLIKPTNDEPGLFLKSFCLDSQGRLVTLLDGTSAGHGAPIPEPNAPATPRGCMVRIIDADGKIASSFAVDFSGHSINVGPDGNIYVGGNGIVAKYDAQGKQLVRTDAPNMAGDAMDEEALRQRAKETLAEQKKVYADTIVSLEKQKKEMEGKSDDELTDEQKEMKGSIDSLIEAYKQAMQSQEREYSEQEIQAIAQSLASRQKTINAIAVNDKYVFVTCAAPKGYGYSIWRTDLEFKNPVMTVEGLSGCCGQMDVQCCGDELVVAENARHRVVRYDADGKEVAKFGKRSRDGIGVGFGSCCNPMNTRLVGDKLYVAESDGAVKLFTVDGEFQSLLGKADVPAGCKSSIVAAAPDGSRIYYFDVQKSGICVLEKQDSNAQARN